MNSRCIYYSSDTTKPPIECARCVLDTWDYPGISFNADGVCDICNTNDRILAQQVKIGLDGQEQLERTLNRIRKDKGRKKYDCLVGVSGGVDSTYLAMKAHEWGLNPLILHVDNGWNAELAVSNIENTLRTLGFDLFTMVLPWNVMRDLQLSFLKSSVLDIDLPFDNAFQKVLYSEAIRFGIKHILFGHNASTEGYLPPNFTHHKLDKENIVDVHSKYGSIPLGDFPLLSYTEMIMYKKFANIFTHSPLDWIEYNKASVKDEIAKKLSWRDYGGKHYENIFTRFYQGYILPEKFGVDKRKSHLSILICSGQMTKGEALAHLARPPYEDAYQLSLDKEFFAKKLGLREEELNKLLSMPPKDHLEFNSVLKRIDTVRRYLGPFKSIVGRFVNS